MLVYAVHLVLDASQDRSWLVDATTFWIPMRKSLGDKRREIPLGKAQDILKILADFKAPFLFAKATLFANIVFSCFPGRKQGSP